MNARSTPKLDLSIWREIGRVLYLPPKQNGAAAMSTEQHEALRTADQVADLCRRFKTPSHERGVCNGATQMIRTQHALIVQMAEALQKLACLGNGQRAGNSIGNLIAQEALEKTGATQYLKGPRHDTQIHRKRIDQQGRL